ncbi:hypothetical protein MMC07_006863 [Pseudocyphellaria aurata]|nr:hypothetical protein [Pseudocyphellaria aurata]
MPIVQEFDRSHSLDSPPPRSARLESRMLRKLSEESIRTEFCDGPIDSPTWIPLSQPEKEPMGHKEGGTCTSDRAELMERIKRGESPTWVPKQPLEDYYRNANERPPSPSIDLGGTRRPTLLPAAEIQDFKPHDFLEPRLSPPIDIQRPRSAWHAGDFTEDSTIRSCQSNGFPSLSQPCKRSPLSGPFGISPTTPWFTPSSSFSGLVGGSESHFPERETFALDQEARSDRAPSLNSYTSSYVLKAPTTPLVHQSNNADLDFTPADLSTSPNKPNRRHTLPPHALRSLQMSPNKQPPSLSHDGYYRRAGTLPHQKHQPRRSLTSNWSLQASSSPQTPGYLRSRKLSYSDTSPLQNASMVGSFEESILRGSMSTAPSKPLDFTAQIGVLGKGNCKPKCPAHVTVPFPAVFYSWGGGVGRSQGLIDDEPSPYVGHIDLQNSLPTAERKKSRERCVQVSNNGESSYESAKADQNPDVDGVASDFTAGKSKKRRRTSSPSQMPVGGSYRIPQVGQLQIVIKNPNKTAVKLYLVPYDLSGMEAETKTFIRQRCYSADPLGDGFSPFKLPGHHMTLGKPSIPKKPALRYLIHLNICSPTKGRFYLYQHIRVVFANRVPDNKEQLQNEIQIPQPRFSTYKPNRDTFTAVSPSAGPRPYAEKAFRRRSAGFGFSIDGPSRNQSTQPYASDSSFPFLAASPIPPIPPIPFSLAISQRRESSPPPRDRNEAVMLDLNDLSRPSTSSSGFNESPQPACNDLPRSFNTVVLSSSYRTRGSGTGSDGEYGKLSPGDEGYGGMFGRPDTPERGEGLLARKLKGLGVRKSEGG